MDFDNFLLDEFITPETLVAGIDEVGRGCLFGPVVAASVVVSIATMPQLIEMGVKDSKKLSAKRRLELAQQIKNLALAYQISYGSIREIERLNILHASLLAMRRTVVKLSVQPEVCLVDGSQKIPNLPILQKNIIKGDERSPVIAAASILAKVWRDELIVRLARKYPQYDLAANKGYGTAKHLLALQQYGASPLHRMSFHPCQVEIK
ncbi:ribonuclease HII [Candidatus Gracilibacteria bacterium]|nr:ribonuclease HII [Candidatus Gracilibacteria bacterium]NJM87313.1 ribonuclease HII [Hydrococcus sp. RU_2_2]NJP19872.1 ribonuclease HII [Hydrococcus sp. CRU_1_1]